MRSPFLLWHLLADSANGLPNKTAVIGPGRSITYAELDRQSSQLAALLLSQGIRSQDRVGIYLDKSCDAIMAIFGILKAGAAYVPLDTAAPSGRISFIMQDCQLAALVTLSKKAGVVEQAGGFRPKLTIHLDTATFPEQLQSTTHSIEQDLAYILYTSGSTGNPKGVMIDHRAALSFVNWATDYFHLCKDDRLSSHAPLHFDLSIFDIFAAIAMGATVFLIPPMTLMFPFTLAAWIAEHKITVWYSVPTALVQLLLYGELEAHDFSALRAILFAGEVFPIQHLRRLQAELPQPRYFNLYGPTETNVCTVYDVPLISAEQTSPCPIGRACANTAVFLLDDQQQAITEPNVTGQLFVRGPTLMRGYWSMSANKSPALSGSSRTLLSSEAGYDTGDSAFINSDGDYVFVGRRDGMIKVRGYRIERGEVEAAAYAHPLVAEAALVVAAQAEGEHELALFITTIQGQSLDRAELDRAEIVRLCKQKMPSYMVPNRIIQLDQLPKTSTGKVDYVNLAAMIDQIY